MQLPTPVSDLCFPLEHAVDYSFAAALPGFEHAGLETVMGLLDECGASIECGAFMAAVIAPTNRASDIVGAQRNADGSVPSSPGFVDACRRYVDSGWGFLSFPKEFGGAQPHYVSDKQKARYLLKMITGEWTGTMNFTAPQAGSDVDALTTRVVATDDESLGQRNTVSALSIEHKLGFHGSPTRVMAYDNVTDDLIGEENQGMRIRLVMMDIARPSVGMEGLASAAAGTGDAGLALALFAPSDDERVR